MSPRGRTPSKEPLKPSPNEMWVREEVILLGDERRTLLGDNVDAFLPFGILN